MKHYYAHSGLAKLGVLPQLYEEHIRNMFQEAWKKTHILSPFLRKATLLAVLFHDFGKLDEHAQKVLSKPDFSDDEMVNHTDAGVAWCIREYQKTQDISFIYAAYLIHAHHIGLLNRDDLFSVKIKNFSRIVEIYDLFRDTKFNDLVQVSVKDYFDKKLDELYNIQYSLLKQEIDQALTLSYKNTPVTPIELRFAFSILVDADHGDTSRHFGAPIFNSYNLKAEQRLEKLFQEVENIKLNALKNGVPKEVIDSRNQLFSECSQIDVHQGNFFVCSAPTGKGKTVSLMQLALRIAKEKEKEKIFFIIPYTNIISQSVQNYRKYVVLDNEDPTKIVNEIHSKVEFDDWLHRKYTHLWNAPINVSTSVQFFESLFSNKPSEVRKLHHFANSVIVFDEFHTALPHHLWEVALITLKDMAEKFNIDIIFGSGTYVYYWDIFSDIHLNVIDVVPDNIFDEFKTFEKNRVTFKNLGVMSNDLQFYEEFQKIATKDGKLIGNTVIVCNTVRNAVEMTYYFKKNTSWKVYHLSSYLTPVDREKILEQIKQQLQKGNDKILLVASSIIECGIDFSFDIGFREYGSMLSTIQFGGRINRNKELPEAYVYEFAFDSQFIQNSNFSRNTNLSASINARNGFDVDMDNCTAVISNEINLRNQNNFVNEEKRFMFSYMKQNFSVIDDMTVSVVIHKDIIAKIMNGDFVDPVHINRNSISIYKTKLDPNNPNGWSQYVAKFKGNTTHIVYWTGPYDPDVYGAYACEIS